MKLITERQYIVIQDTEAKSVEFLYRVEHGGQKGSRVMILNFTEDNLLKSYVDMYKEMINDPLAIMAGGEKHILDVISFLKNFEWNVEFVKSDKPHLSRGRIETSQTLRMYFYFKVC